MNIHHLELFYYVARHRGISQAVRHIPYGIQQPAVSGQVLQLEQDIGNKLFVRTPFQLTPSGETLYAFIRPFFEGLDAVAAQLCKPAGPVLRLGAAELVLRDYLPAMMQQLRTRHPRIQLGLRSGFAPQLEAWVRNREIDLAITPLAGRPPPRLRVLRLVRLPLVLLVPKKARIRSAAELWAQDRIDTPLISMPPDEVATRLFCQGLKRRWVDWPLGIQTSSADLITQYVANGYGFGVSVGLASLVNHPQVRVLPLEGFDPVDVVALWWGQPTPIIQTVLEEAQSIVARQWPQWQCG
jgi:DNA-binding transcriptional LysR family regulator